MCVLDYNGMNTIICTNQLDLYRYVSFVHFYRFLEIQRGFCIIEVSESGALIKARNCHSYITTNEKPETTWWP